jgi:tripartite-type tricarboxylate transporter receptor subunit TctC
MRTLPGAPNSADYPNRVRNLSAKAASPNLHAQLGLEVSLNSPEEFAVVIKSDTAKWAKVIRAANIKAE